jgi:hypothetical protein
MQSLLYSKHGGTLLFCQMVVGCSQTAVYTPSYLLVLLTKLYHQNSWHDLAACSAAACGQALRSCAYTISLFSTYQLHGLRPQQLSLVPHTDYATHGIQQPEEFAPITNHSTLIQLAEHQASIVSVFDGTIAKLGLLSSPKAAASN